MNLCLVCGSDLDDSGNPCSSCQTTREILDTLVARAERHDFLFGSVKGSVRPAAPKRTTAPRKSRGKTKILPKQNAANPARPTADDAIRIPGRDPISTDVIRNRDVTLSTPETPGMSNEPWWRAASSHLLDVGLVMLLNFWVFRLVLILSGRSMEPLLQLSLVPIFFVMLIFTGLYFGLFLAIFRKSFGRMVMEWIQERQRS